MSVLGRAVEARRRTTLAMSRPRPAGDLERQLKVAIKELAAAKAALEEAEAEERDLDGAHVDHFLGTIEPGEYDRRIADVQRRLVECRREVGRWTAIEAGVRERAIDAIGAANDADADAVIAERAKLAHERERLAAKIAKLDRQDDDLAARQATIEAERLPMLARFDAAAAEALAAREKARENEATQLAHRRLRGEDVDVPEELARLVREHEAGIRAEAAERERKQREHYKHIGTVKLDERTYADFDPAGAVRDANLNLGFSDED